MRIWNFWVNTLILSSQYNPPRFIELLMLTLAIAMLIIATITPEKPYLVLGLSFVTGASISILVREAISTTNHSHPPSSQRLITILTSLLLLGISIYGFVDLIRSL
jgi:predicted neutral ceramidase superfamily lipid hydrolase